MREIPREIINNRRLHDKGKKNIFLGGGLGWVGGLGFYFFH